MGMEWKKTLVAVRCETRDCTTTVPGIPAHCRVEHWLDLAEELNAAVTQGWVFKLTGRLGAYCPEHKDHGWSCRCTKGRECPVHDAEIRERMWDQTTMPALVGLHLQEVSE